MLKLNFFCITVLLITGIGCDGSLVTDNRFTSPYEGIDDPIDEAAIAESLVDRPDALTDEFFEAAAVTQTVFEAAPADIPVTLQRVRYAKKCFGVCTFADNENFPQWPDQGVSKDNRKATYIAVTDEPPVSSVNTLVLLSAGQQGIDIFPGKGTENVVTGQKSHWRKNWKKGASISYNADRRSLFAKLRELDWFDRDTTFTALVFDAAFYYTTSTDEKTDMENAYANWLLSKADAANIEQIVFAAASRGGCLLARLAGNIRERSAYNNAKIYFAGFDAVCNKNQSELATEKTAVFNNIMNPDGCLVGTGKCWYGWQGNMQDHYTNTANLYLLQIFGGYNVNFGDNLAGDPRAFSDRTAAAETSWYEELEVPYTHKEIGRSYNSEIIASTVDGTLNWLEAKLND